MTVSNVFSQIALYRVRSYQVADVHERLSSCSYIASRLVTIAVGLGFIVPYVLVTCPSYAITSVFLYTVFRSIDVFIDVFHGIDQQHQRMDLCGKSLMIRGVLFLLAFCFGLSLFHNITIAILSMVVATLPIALLDVRWASRFSEVKPIFDLKKICFILKECFPTVCGMSLCSLVVTIARQYLSFSDGASALGIYASVSTPIVVIQACVSYVYSPFLGRFASLADDNNARGFFSLLIKILGIMFAIFISGTLLFALFGEGLLRMVFGDQIAGFSYLMPPALISSSLTACVSLLSDVLVTAGDMKGVLYSNALGFVVSAPLTILLVNMFGMNGVSYTVSASYLFASLAMGLRLLKCFAIGQNQKKANSTKHRDI